MSATGAGERAEDLARRAVQGVEAVPAWLRGTGAENRLPVLVAVVVATVLQVLLPQRLSLPPGELLPAVEVGLLVVLTVANPVRLNRDRTWLRALSVGLVVVMTLGNAVSAFRLAELLVRGRAGDDATALLLSGGAIYATNVIAFGLWYWELDRGGPFARQRGERPYPDFLFPQMATREIAPPHWEPRFLDYLYLSYTNATAFSPTDTMPLARWAKALMGVQSLVALVTVALVVARAVNILK